MIVRGLDDNNDWLFGKSWNDYRRGNDAISQNVQTRIMSFLGDCFFDAAAGIDWWNKLGSKNIESLRLDIGATILNTENVTKLNQLVFSVDENRIMSIRYSINTFLGQIVEDEIVLPSANLLDENGNTLTDEDSNPLSGE